MSVEVQDVPPVTDAADAFRKIILERMPDCEEAVVEDVSGGCGSAMSVKVVSPVFVGKMPLAKHRLVQTALSEEITQLHAFTLVSGAFKRSKKYMTLMQCLFRNAIHPRNGSKRLPHERLIETLIHIHMLYENIELKTSCVSFVTGSSPFVPSEASPEPLSRSSWEDAVVPLAMFIIAWRTTAKNC